MAGVARLLMALLGTSVWQPASIISPVVMKMVMMMLIEPITMPISEGHCRRFSFFAFNIRQPTHSLTPTATQSKLFSRWSLSCTLSLSLTTFYCDSNLLCHTDRQTVPHLVVPCMQSEQFVLFFLFPPTVCTHKTTTESSSSLSSSSVLPGRWTHFTGTLKLPSAGDDGVVVVVVTVLAQGESDVGSFNSEFVSINQRSAPLLLCSRNTGTCKSSTGTVSH